MAQNYFSIVTNIGRNKLALSAAGGAAVTITHFAIGDGNGAEVNPTAASTALIREVWRTPVESVVIDPLNPSAVLVTSIIPTAAGGWWMREFGIFDVDGDMVAVAKPVSQYKPTALEGQLEDIRYEFQIIIGETANVTMLVDPSVLLASRDFVEKRKVPVAQLSLTPWVPVKSITVTAPPANPTAWDTYVIPAGATGTWAGHAQKLAEWNGAAWNIITPPEGHGVSLPDGRIFERVGGVYVEKQALDVQSGKWIYAEAAGTANVLTATLAPLPMALVPGMMIRLKIATTNTGAATLNVNGLGAKPISTLKGNPLGFGDLPGGSVVSMIYTGTAWTIAGLTYSEVPQLYSQDFTLYVRTDGNDNNDGSANTAAAAFKTIDAALAYGLNRFFIVAGKSLIIQLGIPGTYAPPNTYTVSSSPIIIRGDPANIAGYILSGAGPAGGGSAVISPYNSTLTLSGVNVHNTGSINVTFTAGNGYKLSLNNVIASGTGTPSAVFRPVEGGRISIGSNVTISQSATQLFSISGGAITLNANLTISGTPTYTTTIDARYMGTFERSAVTMPVIVGLANGQRFYVGTNSVINTYGGGNVFFPGTTAGTTDTATGGVYV